MSSPHPLELGPEIRIEELGATLRARREQLARACNDPNALRVCTVNLAAFCHDENRCGDAHDALSAMVVEHPGRLFLIHAHREVTEPLLRARVAVDGTPMGQGVPPTYSELIDIYASGPDVDFLPSVLTSLLEADQPACAWWCTPPTFGPIWERMSHTCDRMVIDSVELDAWDLMRLVEYVKSDTAASHRDDHAALGDLNWARIKPLAALVARFFDAPQVREKLAQIERIVLHHTPAAPHLTAIGPAMLGAWTRDRLAAAGRAQRLRVAPRVEMVKVPRVDLQAGEVAEITLLGKDVELAVSRPDAKSVLAEARKGVNGLAPQRLRTHTHQPSWLLSQELQIYGRDPLFEAAFLAGIDLLRESRR